jgi:hypothetical protein
MASTESTKSSVWECGAAVSATSTAGTKISIQSSGVCRISLSRLFMAGTISILDAMAENPARSRGRH